MIFINGPVPEIIIFNLETGEVKEYNYKPEPNLIDIGLYNTQKGILCLFYLHYT